MDNGWLEGLAEQIKAQPIALGLAGVGLVLMIFGIKESRMVESEPEVEIMAQETEESEVSEEIWVDVSGAVVKPGVYKVKGGSRVGEVLDQAGGFDQEADFDLIAKQINLAAPLGDGQKVFVPFKSVSVSSDKGEAETVGQVDEGLVNINSASLSQLDELWGIGEARAQAIIDNRPYGTKEELKDKAGIPQNVYERIEEQVSVY